MANGQRMILALIMILVVEARDVSGQWKPEVCIRDCMPFCMKVVGATEAACNHGCGLGCEQLRGRGSNLGLSVANYDTDVLERD
ncbi:hypothetical protein ACJRO7_001063 [Eucalyptus globulus]|uniref:Uncharacterized protein n=1 Tax=Eucalyptus globulus TaxID=34317 RepID=A0ABD3LTD1_EUCGL